MVTMRLLVLSIVAFTAACGKTSSSTGSSAAAGSAAPGASAAAPQAADLGPCPKDRALAEKLAALYATTADKVSGQGCVAGKFPAPGWYVTARVDDGASTIERTSVVDGAGKLVVDEQQEVPPGIVDSSASENHRVFDFDGDGTDEVVYVFRSDKGGYASDTLMVVKLVGGKWTFALTREFASDNSAALPEDGAEACHAEWALDEKARTLVFRPSKMPTDGRAGDCIFAAETWKLGTDHTFKRDKPAVASKWPGCTAIDLDAVEKNDDLADDVKQTVRAIAGAIANNDAEPLVPLLADKVKLKAKSRTRDDVLAAARSRGVQALVGFAPAGGSQPCTWRFDTTPGAKKNRLSILDAPGAYGVLASIEISKQADGWRIIELGGTVDLGEP
jgi:hypothetical protein